MVDNYSTNYAFYPHINRFCSAQNSPVCKYPHIKCLSCFRLLPKTDKAVLEVFLYYTHR